MVAEVARNYSSPSVAYSGSYYDQAFRGLRGDRVLELGCANGRIGVLIRANASHVRELHGVDFDRGLLDGVPEGVYDSLEELDLEMGSPCLSGPLSDVLALDVLEHLRDPRATLRRLAPLVEDGGRLVIGVPNFLHLKNRIRIFFGKWRYEDAGGMYDIGHVRWFGLSNLDQLVPAEIFEIVDIQGFGWFPQGNRASRGRLIASIVRFYLRIAGICISLGPSLFSKNLVLVCVKRGTDDH